MGELILFFAENQKVIHSVFDEVILLQKSIARFVRLANHNLP